MREAGIDPCSCQPFHTLLLHLCHLLTIGAVRVGCCKKPQKIIFIFFRFLLLIPNKSVKKKTPAEESIGRLILFFTCQGNTNPARLLLLLLL